MRKHKRSTLFSGKRSIPIKIGLGVVLLILIIIIFIPSESAPSSNAEVAAIRSRGTLRVAVSNESNGFMNESSEGLEAQIATRIASEIFHDANTADVVSFTRVNPSFMDTHFSDASVDIALMQCPRGLYSSKYSYSDPYYTDSCLIIIKRDSDAHSSLDGMKIGIIENSICEIRLNSYIETTELNITPEKYPTYELMLSALQFQRIDACVMPGTAYNRYSSNAYRSHGTQLDGIQYAVVCSSENIGLTTFINSVIKDMKESGELETLVNTYIGG